MGCEARMPPLSAGELEAELVRRAPVPASRRRSIEALLDSVEEALSSEEPVVVMIVGEWGEGKTAAWHAYVKPRLKERGVKLVEVRAASLAEAMGKASWVPSPAWRLATALVALVEGSVPGDYRAGVERLLGGGPVVVFIDEVEDLVYRRGSLEALLEALHGIVDGELGGYRLHFYLSLSPTAYARVTSWVSWRRFRRRIRVVELKPLTRAESLEALRAMIGYACGDCRIVSDPRLLNGVVAAARGNLGALAAYTRRLLAAWLRRGCEPLGVDDVVRVLEEPLVAGLEAAGLDPGLVARVEAEAGRRGVEALVEILVDEAEGLEGLVVEAAACREGAGDEAWVSRDGSIVYLGGGWAEEASSLGWRVSPRGCEGRVYAVRPRVVAAAYGGGGGVASFILDESLRREALRASYSDARLAALGLATLICAAAMCSACRWSGGVALLEARVRGLPIRLAVVAPGVEPGAARRVLGEWRPHVVLAPRGLRLEVPPARLIWYELDASLLLRLGALGYVSSNCRPDRVVDQEKLGVLAAEVLRRIGFPERVLEALEEGYPLIVPPLAAGGVSPEKLACIARVAGASPGEPPSVIGERAAEYCGVTRSQFEEGLRRLMEHGVLVLRDGGVYPGFSRVERSIVRLLELMGGSARLAELKSLLVPLRGHWGSQELAWFRLAAVKGWVKAPKRLTERSKLSLLPLEELRREAEKVLDSGVVPSWAMVGRERCGDETCERAWLASILWLHSIEARKRRVETGTRVEELAARLPVAQQPVKGVPRTAPAVATGVEEEGAGGAAGRAALQTLDGARLRVLNERLLEAVRLAPLALEQGRLEELAETITRAKMLAKRGKVDDALMELSAMLASLARSPDALLLETVRRLDGENLEAIELVEKAWAKRKALEKLVARSAAKLVARSLAVLHLRVIRDTGM